MSRTITGDLFKVTDTQGETRPHLSLDKGTFQTGGFSNKPSTLKVHPNQEDVAGRTSIRSTVD